MKAPLPANEPERLRALRDYGVMDTPPELAFDDLTHLAAKICATPTALVTLIDENRQWFKSLHGFTSTETKRDLAFCAHTILGRDVMVVPDAAKDPRFADNELVSGAPYIRFYAGAPLITSTGFALGSLAVIDYVPRELSAEQIEELQALSRQAIAQLELRRMLREHQAHAYAALLASERRYRRLFDSNIIGVMIANTDGRITEANDLFLRSVGYTREELQAGRVRWDTMTPPEWRAADESIIAELRANGVCPPVEKEYVRKDGSRVPILVTIALLEGAPGDCICVIEDLTARKQAEAALHLLNTELEQRVLERTEQLATKNRELESFTYAVSHDLKAPLRGIDGYSRLLLEDHAAELNEEGRTFLANVRQATLRMGELIDDLLTYTKLERRTIELVPVDLVALTRAILADYTDEIQTRGVRLELEMPPITLRADVQSLTMALRNLVDNAFKFTRQLPRPVVTIGGRVTATTFILWVRDNGSGFDQKFHERIFEIFQRLHRTEDYPGTGVGLAIVRKAMERMGGRSWAESQLGQGATFYLEMPL